MNTLFTPTQAEIANRDRVLELLITKIRRNEQIPFIMPHLTSPFGGRIGEYHFIFEGEDDLLHLQVTRHDGLELRVEEGQAVAAFVLDKIPAALLWLKPGKYSQHFYLAHDLLLTMASMGR